MARIEKTAKCVAAAVLPVLLYTSLVFAAKLTLTWNDPADNEEGFIIERKTDGAFVEIARIGANSVTYVDMNVPSGRLCYQVKAFNAAGQSEPSNEACIDVPTIPNKPTGLHITVTFEFTNQAKEE